MEFSIYVPSLQVDKVNAFLADVNDNLARSAVRETIKSPESEFIDRNNTLYLVEGRILFTSSTDAQRTYSDLVTLSTVNRGFLEYGEIYLTDNTHHYPNPQPDIITNSDLKGTRSNLEKYDLQR